LLLLPVPAGASVEEAGEALEVRVGGGHVFVDTSPTAVARRRALAAEAVGADPSLARDDAAPDGCIVLAAGGLQFEIDAAFVVCRADYAREGEEAEQVFERLFKVIGAAVRETGWRVYDPQGACVVEPDDDGRAATLEIYLSVVDSRGIAAARPDGPSAQQRRGCGRSPARMSMRSVQPALLATTIHTATTIRRLATMCAIVAPEGSWANREVCSSCPMRPATRRRALSARR